MDDFIHSCTMFGEELLEMALDILDQATESMEATTTTTTMHDVAHDAIQVTWTCLSTTRVLQQGLDIPLASSMVQSLFTTYASFVAVWCHKQMGSTLGMDNDSKQFACELLVELANYALLPQESATICSNTTTNTTAAMETALSMTLLCALDAGISNDDALLTPILEYMHQQQSSDTASVLEEEVVVPTAANKRQRRQEQDDDKSCPFTDILQTCVMATLMMVPSSNTTTPTRTTEDSKETVARCLQSIPSSQTDNPWHSLVSRKVKESFDIDTTTTTTTTTNSGDEDADTRQEPSWSQGILQQYVANHPQRPLFVLLENE